MGFWSDAASTEPKRQHRWIITFPTNAVALGPYAKGLSFAAKKVSKPSAKVGSITHKYLNHFFNFPGRLEWNDVSITFASITDPDATTALMGVLATAGYQRPTAEPAAAFQRQTISKNKFRSAIGNISIQQVDAEGTPIESWVLNNAFFTEVKFGELDYGNEEIVDITCTVKYDWADLSSVKTNASQPRNA